jgi:hypothetical protein
MLKSRNALQENVGQHVHVPGTVAGKTKKAALQHTPFHPNTLRELVIPPNCAACSYNVLQSHRKPGSIKVKQLNPRERNHLYPLDLSGTKHPSLIALSTIPRHYKLYSLCSMSRLAYSFVQVPHGNILDFPAAPARVFKHRSLVEITGMLVI